MPENWLSCQTPGCRYQTLKMDTEQCPVCGCNALKAARPLALTCQQCKTSVAERGAPAACPTCGGWLARQKRPKIEREQEAQKVGYVGGVGLDDFDVGPPSVLGLALGEFDARFGRPSEETLDQPWKLDSWLKQRGLPTLAATPSDAPKPKRKESDAPKKGNGRKADPYEIKDRSEQAVQRIFQSLGGEAPKNVVWNPRYQIYASNGVDLRASLMGQSIPTEVKGVSLIDSGAGLCGGFKFSVVSKKEVEHLDKSLARGSHPLLAIVWWDVTDWTPRKKGRSIKINFLRWAALAEIQAALKAHQGGRNQGKRIRFQYDAEALDSVSLAVLRSGRSWGVSADDILREAIR